MKLEANKDPQSSTMTSTKQLYFEHFFHVKDSLVLRNGLKNTLVGCTLHILSKTHTVGPYIVHKQGKVRIAVIDCAKFSARFKTQFCHHVLADIQRNKAALPVQKAQLELLLGFY